MVFADLMRHVKDILDKRKGWLADDNETSTEVQEMRIIHLKTLFARLEDEQFKADAEQFEFKVRPTQLTLYLFAALLQCPES